MNPGYLVGGVPLDLPSGSELGDPEAPFVIEGDEYDSAFFDKRSKFIHYRPRIPLLGPPSAHHEDVWPTLVGLRRCGRPNVDAWAWRRLREKKVQESLGRPLVRQLLDVVLPLGANHVDGHIDQISNHRLHVPPHVTDLGVLRRLHLHERGTRQTGKATRNLGLPDPRGTDQDEVVREDLFPKLFLHSLPAPAVSEGDGDGLLGFVLTHDVLIQLGNDLARCELIQPLLMGLILALVGRLSVGGYGKPLFA